MNKNLIIIEPDVLAKKLKVLFDPYYVRGIENWKRFASLGSVFYYSRGTIFKNTKPRF